ncbi:MAG TPA: zinc-binding dehydrogenase [Streptosporangiaceae bacterium]|nr:zinc-binding dehydrogenase [Streptosporangiaceae bacterium]
MAAMKALLPAGGRNMVEFGDVGQPHPADDEALIRVEAFSVNRGETFLLEKPRPAGWRPGKDVAGLVVQAAADGSGPATGTRVAGHPPASGWAEYVSVPTNALAVLPDRVGVVSAAALPLAGLTALRLTRVAAKAAEGIAGRRILLTGASGGVGHYFTELAANAGAEVTAITASPERGARLTDLGARAVFQAITDAERPFDLVLESVGGGCMAAGLDVLRPGGTLIWFGQASRRPVTVSFFDLLYGATSATIQHFSYADSPVPYGDDLAVLLRLVASGRLHPEIGRIADWADTGTVLADLRDRRIRGNAVLTIGGFS